MLISKLSSQYGEFAKHIPELKGLLSSSAYKKQQLLKMAGRGEPKPRRRTKIGEAFVNYTQKGSKFYDPAFTKQIGKIAPDWFLSKSEYKKQQLLEMARKGEPKPKHKHRLYYGFYDFTWSKSRRFDKDFTKEIRSIRPDWFLSNSDHKKQILLDMASKGEPRPKRLKDFRKSESKIAHAFFSYIRKDGNYDPAFTKQIKKLAPHWFVSQSDIAKQKKKQILLMASKGEPRPLNGDPLGEIFFRHAFEGKFGYDPAFAKQIRKLAPHWFPKPETDDQKKKKLLEMAKEGKSKPSSNKLAKSLGDFVNRKSKSFDRVFFNKIKKITPRWFPKEIMCEKKQKLIELAKSGILKSRPNARNHPLGLAFSTYVLPHSKAYDPDFISKIKKIAPCWFIRQVTIQANQKKQKMLELAGLGDNLPQTLRVRFFCYTNKNSKSYDPAFAKQIKKLSPHWFKRKCSTK